MYPGWVKVLTADFTELVHEVHALHQQLLLFCCQDPATRSSEDQSGSAQQRNPVE